MHDLLICDQNQKKNVCACRQFLVSNIQLSAGFFIVRYCLSAWNLQASTTCGHSIFPMLLWYKITCKSMSYMIMIEGAARGFMDMTLENQPKDIRSITACAGFYFHNTVSNPQCLSFRLETLNRVLTVMLLKECKIEMEQSKPNHILTGTTA